MKVRTAWLAPAVIFLLATLAQSQTTVTFQQNTHASPDFVSDGVRIDANQDGADDLITIDFAKPGFWVFINNGDGTLRAPVHYQLDGAIARRITTGDWNNDGVPDVALSEQFAGNLRISIWLGNGDGTFRAVSQIASFTANFAVADFNRDGNLDLALGWQGIAYGDGKGNFSPPKSLGFSSPSGGSSPWTVLAGDFDADGKADLFIGESVYARDFTPTTWLTTLYGNGDGTFTKVEEQNQYNGQAGSVGDVDQDGKGDVVLAINTGPCGAPCTPGVRILYGSSARNFNRRVSINAGDEDRDAEVADMNGDGRQDILLRSRGNTHNLVMLLQNADGSFTEQDYPVGGLAQGQDIAGPIFLGDFNHDRKPDVIVDRYNSSTLTKELLVLLNTTDATGFPTCSPPGAVGINVCSPVANGSATSPARFSIGAQASTPLRKIEVWVDGSKKNETFYSWANKSFMEVSFALSTGQHSATVYAAGYDNRLLRKDFAFVVGATSSDCAAPSATTLNICSPTQGSTVTSSVHVRAQGGSSVTFMEVWVDGTKPYQTAGNHVDTSLNLAAGTHAMTIYARSGSTVTDHKSVSFTVSSSSGTCTPPSATTVAICSPVNGSTVTSPIHAVAQGGASVTWLDVWVDGTKVFSRAGNSMDTTFTFGNGPHTMTVYAITNGNPTDKKSVTFTVSSGGGGGTCSQPTSATTTVICSPANGSSVTNPVSLQARGGSSVNLMEVWVDGTKRFQTSGNSVSTSLTLAAGSHKLTVFGKNGSTVLSSAVSNFTVH